MGNSRRKVFAINHSADIIVFHVNAFCYRRRRRRSSLPPPLPPHAEVDKPKSKHNKTVRATQDTSDLNLNMNTVPRCRCC